MLKLVGGVIAVLLGASILVFALLACFVDTGDGRRIRILPIGLAILMLSVGGKWIMEGWESLQDLFRTDKPRRQRRKREPDETKAPLRSSAIRTKSPSGEKVSDRRDREDSWDEEDSAAEDSGAPPRRRRPRARQGLPLWALIAGAGGLVLLICGGLFLLLFSTLINPPQGQLPVAVRQPQFQPVVQPVQNPPVVRPVPPVQNPPAQNPPVVKPAPPVQNPPAVRPAPPDQPRPRQMTYQVTGNLSPVEQEAKVRELLEAVPGVEARSVEVAPNEIRFRCAPGILLTPINDVLKKLGYRVTLTRSASVP